ncbi:MAG TPA: alpha/beta hydrolase [Solirubrobacterales bacterium]|nr:alpha/beta hydrolase [Solirubrobacterales bacterium]
MTETSERSGDGSWTTFVLIPGAGADPRVYEATIAALRDLGQDGLAPPLPLEDPDAGPSAHADAVIAALPEPHPDPLVIVGQSLGAYTAAVLADRLGPRRLILLAPMIPKLGETAGDWWEDTGHAEAIASLTARLGPPEDWDEAALDEVFYHDVDAATLAANDEYDGRPAPGMFAEPLRVERWPYAPTTVLAPRDDRLFPLEFQRRLTRERLGEEAEFAEMPGGHLPMLSRPRELAARLVELSSTRP